MKKCACNLVFLPLFIVGLCSVMVGQLTAQTFTTLHSFTGGTLGGWHVSGLNSSGSILYGTTGGGGASSNGTVFAINTNGTGFTNLYSFDGYPSDGAIPHAELVLSANTLYGTTSHGGDEDAGTVFAINTNGTGFATLYSFTSLSFPGQTNDDGTLPSAGLILSGNTLYGTAVHGGDFGAGTVFSINSDGNSFATLHSFTQPSGTFSTNSDGAGPYGTLLLSGSTLFGTALQGGIHVSGNGGTVFAINTDGMSFKNLHSFAGFPTDGDNPEAGLILSGNTLYGTTVSGGSGQFGTVFRVNTDGSGFGILHNFDGGTPNSSGIYTNSDGSSPSGGLAISGDKLYGTAAGGGQWGSGTVFEVNTNGTGFKPLHSFAALIGDTSHFNVTNSDGVGPGGLMLSGNILYGTTSMGGSSGWGTVFNITLPPQLTIIPLGANVILTWLTNAIGYTLQSTTNLVSPVWTTNFPVPVVVNGQYTVTNPISGTRQFFRLSQ